MNLIYNENKYILKIEKDDISIGSIQENILKTCSLIIYNIENTELFLKNGKSFILGSEHCIFKEKISNFIKNNVNEITDPLTNNDETTNYLLEIDKFIVYDRKRDEKGNVIKNNIIIDNYNIWFQENENLKYLNQSQYNKYQSTYQNNNIISLFSNIFENSILNYQNDSEYINNLFRNYVNVNNDRIPTTPNEDQTDENEEKEDENIQSINTTINEVQIPDITDPIINDIPINNNEFSNMVNIFDTYINNSSREQYINNNRNSILYNYFNNMYSTVNDRNRQNNNTEVNNTETEENDNNTEENNTETEENNNIQSNNENNDYIQLNNNVNEFITENNINTFINNAPIFNLLRNMSNNIEIDEPTIVNSNDDYITFSVPISIYNNNTQHNFEDVVVSLTDDEFNELTCYECNEENNEKDCNICIECFNKDDSIVKLNCNHEFHKDCIKKWLCNNSTKCPVCRVEVAKGKANL
jgi:hypothetical protein